jgi:uncharacterized protein (TIGR03437 family)
VDGGGRRGFGFERGDAGLQGGFVGLDQINVQVPRSLSGRGAVDVSLAVDAQTTNPVSVIIQ